MEVAFALEDNEKQQKQKSNIKKTDSIRIDCSNPRPFTTWTDVITEVDKYASLGVLVTKWKGADEDMLGRFGKARCVYHNLKNVQNSSQYRTSIQTKICETYVLSVLLYGQDTWTINKYNEERIDIFVKKF